MIDAARQRRAFYATGLMLAALAWALLWAWSQSPWGRFLDHGGWARIGLVGAICGAPLGGALGPAAAYAGGWLLMLAAMMLPTALPVLHLVERLAARRPD